MSSKHSIMKRKITMDLFKQIGSVALLASLATTASATSYPTSIVRDIDAGTVTITNPNNEILKYSYDDVDNLESISVGAEATPSYSFEYDATDQLTNIAYPGGSQTFTIDPNFDRVTEVYDFGEAAPMLLFDYDHKHRITWITYPGGTEVCYEYDADGRLTRVGRAYTTNAGICANADEKTDYAYDARGRLETITYPNNIVGFLTYYPDTGLLNTAGYKRANGTLIYSDVFEYVIGSNLYKSVTRATSTDKQTTHYQYDDYQRLTQVTEPNGRRTVYEYDDFGNRTKETITNIKDATATAAQGQKAYGVYDYIYTNKSNRLEQLKFNDVPLESYTYDDAGQMDIRSRDISGGTDVTDYDFNALGKLIKVTLPDTSVIEYTYDALGVRKTKSINGSLDTQYLSANIFGLPHVLMELDADLGIKASYVYAGGQQIKEEPNSSQRTDDLYKLHNGMIGNITHEMNMSGVVKNEYGYDAFGARTNLSATSGHQHYGYTGEEFDTETGLLYLRARYYDPSLGRFISADPYLGRVAMPVTQNRFIYVHNNPLGFVDPSGLAVEDWWDLKAKYDYVTQRAEDIGRTLLKDPQYQGSNDISDARRHSEWNRRMTEEFGETWTFLIGTGHEVWDNAYKEQFAEGEPIKWDEIFMDLHNNSVGREAGANGTPINDNDLREIKSGGSHFETVGGNFCVY